MLVGVQADVRCVGAKGSVWQECGIRLVREGTAAVRGEENCSRIRKVVILAVGVRAQHEYGVGMACRTDHALVVPALSGAEIVCRVARIGDAGARFLHERRAARLHRFGDEQTTVGLTRSGPAVTSRLINSSMTVIRCSVRKLAPVGAGP